MFAAMVLHVRPGVDWVLTPSGPVSCVWRSMDCCVTLMCAPGGMCSIGEVYLLSLDLAHSLTLVLGSSVAGFHVACYTF